jgi:hypothetical protein
LTTVSLQILVHGQHSKLLGYNQLVVFCTENHAEFQKLGKVNTRFLSPRRGHQEAERSHDPVAAGINQSQTRVLVIRWVIPFIFHDFTTRLLLGRANSTWSGETHLCSGLVLSDTATGLIFDSHGAQCFAAESRPSRRRRRLGEPARPAHNYHKARLLLRRCSRELGARPGVFTRSALR